MNSGAEVTLRDLIPNTRQSSRRGMKKSSKRKEVLEEKLARCFTLRTKRESGRDVKQRRDPHETAGRRLSRFKTTEEEKHKVMNANRRRETIRGLVQTRFKFLRSEKTKTKEK